MAEDENAFLGFKEHLEQHWQLLQLPSSDEILDIYVEPREAIVSRPPEYARSIAQRILSIYRGQVPPAVGVSEAGIILGVSKQRVDQLKHKGIIPEPFQKLAATPLWSTAEIIVCAITRNRHPGQQAKNTNKK